MSLEGSEIGKSIRLGRRPPRKGIHLHLAIGHDLRIDCFFNTFLNCVKSFSKHTSESCACPSLHGPSLHDPTFVYSLVNREGPPGGRNSIHSPLASALNSAIWRCISSSFSRVIDFKGMILGLQRIWRVRGLSLVVGTEGAYSDCKSQALAICPPLLSFSLSLSRRVTLLTSLGLCFSEKINPDFGRTS